MLSVKDFEEFKEFTPSGEYNFEYQNIRVVCSTTDVSIICNVDILKDMYTIEHWYRELISFDINTQEKLQV